MMVIHIVRTWNSENKSNYKKTNEVVYTFLTLAFGTYYPLLVGKLGSTKKGILLPNTLHEFTLLGNIFIVGVMLGVFGWALSAKIRTIKNPELLEGQNNYENFCENFLKEYTEKSNFKRKITHILPGAVVGLCIIVFYLFFRSFLGDEWINYALFVIVIIGVDFALTFITQDLIRLFDFSYMPPKAIKMCNAGLYPDELDTFSSTSVMVFAFGPFIFCCFPILFIVILITSVADAMATIFSLLFSGGKYKKHHFPKNTDKSVEGYIGGFIFTFISTIIAIIFSNSFNLSDWSVEIMFILALILSIIFVLIDIMTSKIKLQDNYLNPLIIGFVLVIILLNLNMSII
jgi:dolichol kinase